MTNFRRDDESPSEYADRVERAETCAGRCFADATKAQAAIYQRAMADLRGLIAPRYDRARQAAKAAFKASTTAASELSEETLRELLTDGEVSEALNNRWDLLALPSYEEALQDPKKARALFDASKGGNVRGITEDHRFALADVFAKARETV
jgi:hypothetical protein